jgi:tetratricopeptide (TPR) repeat protein
MIVKNEQAVLGHCLASVKELVDEIIVLDTGSTDGTVAVARSFGARVESFRWVGDFSAARNAAIAHCTGDWVLVLDADEAIDPLDHPVIRQALENPDFDAYYLWLRDYFRSGAFVGISGAVKPNRSPYGEGREFSHQYSYQAVRLFRAQREPVFQGRIHELAEEFFKAKGLRLGFLEAVIHHYGKVDPDKDRAKQGEYTRLAKVEAAADPGSAIAHYNVVQQGLLVEDWEAVLASAQAYLRLVPKVPMMIYLGAARALQGLGRPSESLKYLDAMLADQPRHAVALCAKGESLEVLGRKEEAQVCFLGAVDAEPGFTLPFLRLARLLDGLGRPAEARQVLEAGLDQNPLDEVLWGELVGLSARRTPERAPADAWDAVQAVPDGGKGIWHQLVAVALLARGDRSGARLVAERGLQAFPGDLELLDLRRRAGNA